MEIPQSAIRSPQSGRGVEVEVKIAVADARALRRALRRLGFREVERSLERDTVLDTPALDLRKSLCLLRLRKRGQRWTLTYKGPPAADRRYKAGPEIETDVAEGHRFLEICGRLGYRPVFVYEKRRGTWRCADKRPNRRAAGHGPVAALDVTPIGTFLELEGPRRWIDRTARTLGFDARSYITASYGQLYIEYCRKAGREPTNMVFGP